MRKEKNNIKFNYLYSENTNVSLNHKIKMLKLLSPLLIENKTVNNDDIISHPEIKNCTFTSIEINFKFKENTIRELKNFNFDGIVNTTKNEIAKITEFNNQKKPPFKMVFIYCFIASLLLALPVLFGPTEPNPIFKHRPHSQTHLNR